MNRKARTYRLSDTTLRELREIASTMGISETEAVSRAIHFYYVSLKGEETGTISGSIVPFSEYKSLQDQLKQVLYRTGELEGRLKEREERLKEKDALIRELMERIKELQPKVSRRWWEFWKR